MTIIFRDQQIISQGHIYLGYKAGCLVKNPLAYLVHVSKFLMLVSKIKATVNLNVKTPSSQCMQLELAD